MAALFFEDGIKEFYQNKDNACIDMGGKRWPDIKNRRVKNQCIRKHTGLYKIYVFRYGAGDINIHF